MLVRGIFTSRHRLLRSCVLCMRSPALASRGQVSLACRQRGGCAMSLASVRGVPDKSGVVKSGRARRPDGTAGATKAAGCCPFPENPGHITTLSCLAVEARAVKIGQALEGENCAKPLSLVARSREAPRTTPRALPIGPGGFVSCAMRCFKQDLLHLSAGVVGGRRKLKDPWSCSRRLRPLPGPYRKAPCR